MKKRAFSLLLALLLLVSCCVPAFAASGRGTDASAGLTMVGHRGYSAIAPENTLAAFRLAGEAGFRGAECDVSRTVDGRWVVIHDDTVDRTTNGTGKVRDLTFEEIRALKIDGGNGLDRYPDEQIPTLEEFLTVCRAYGMRPFVEVKEANPVAEMDDLARVLRESGDDCVLISFGREHIAALHALLPENETYLLTRFPSADDVRFCKATGLTGVDLRYPAPFAEGVLRRAQAAGLRVAAWTVDEPIYVRELRQKGVGLITTNALSPADVADLSGVSATPVDRLVIRVRTLLSALLGALREAGILK